MRLCAHPKLHAGKLVAVQEIDDAFDAVVAAVRSLATDAQLSGRQGDVIKQYNDMLRRDFVEIGRVADSLAAVVHKGLRLHQKAAPVFYCNVGHDGFEFDPVDFHAELLCEQVDA